MRNTYRNFLCLFVLIAGLALSTPVFAQTITPTPAPDDSEGITGIWIGVLRQIEGGGRAAYPFVLALTQVPGGDGVLGTSFIALPDSPSHYALIALTGSVTNGRFDFEETEIVSQNVDDDGLRWCIKHGTLLLDETGQALSGAWQGNDTCVPGLISVRRVSEDTMLSSIAQSQTVSGIWVGSLYQESSSDNTSGYPFAMVLSQDQSNNSVSGTSFIALPDDPSTYAAINLVGTLAQNEFDFTETEIVAEPESKPFRWCMKNGLLTLDGRELSGAWQGDATCESGSLVLVRLV